MDLINGVYIKDFEWESFDFPLKLTSVSMKLGYYNFPSDSLITITRDELFNIKATIEFASRDKNACEYREISNSLDKGQFIEGESLIAFNNIHKYELKDCTIRSYSVAPADSTFLTIYFVADLIINSITEINENEAEVDSVADWFLTSKSGIRYQRQTDRFSSGNILKVRKTVDKEVEITNDNIRHLRGGAWDFFIVKLDEFSFIVQETPKEILPSWANGISIEYRMDLGEIPSKETRVAISEILSFVLGVEFIKVGTSKFNIGKKVIRRYANKPLGDNIIDRCKNGRLPPIHFDEFYARTNVEDKIKDIIPAYLKLRKHLGLDTAIWKYWIGRNAMIGTNLPIMSSSIEGMADKYLKYYSKISNPSDEEKRKYEDYCKANNDFIDGLQVFSFTKSLIDKINNPYDITGGEKMRIFFKSLGLNFHKKSIETKALKSRNLMAHSSIDTSMNEAEILMLLKKTVRLTRAYETLFNRVMLKILGYNGKYIDYYTFGHPALELSENIKANDKMEGPESSEQ